MLQVSRDNNLKIPKELKNISGNVNSIEDKVAVKEAFATSENEKFDAISAKQNLEDDKELSMIQKIEKVDVL